ncbi:MAG: prefoldin subunit alpha [Candidatus Syntropharchaeales archaeon]|nr:prefoldin subunit alpha [Candidatus Syntrophoarchaeum sp.]
MAMNIDKEHVQEMIAKLRQLQVQAESYTHQITAVQASLTDHEKALLTLNAVEKMEDGGELLVSVGAGAAVYATLTRKDKVIVGLGGGVSAEKDIKSAIEIITKRQEELSNSHKQLTEILAGVEAEAQKIEQELQAISVQMERQG